MSDFPTRLDAVIYLDRAIDALQGVKLLMDSMGATYSMSERIESRLRELTDLRVDIMQADLLREGE